MNDILFKLSLFIDGNSPSLRSHYYRHQKILETKCGSFVVCKWLKTDQEFEFAKTLSDYGPLLREDLEHKFPKNLINKFSHLPNDPKFFTMTLKQMSLWKKFKDSRLIDFLKSEEGIRWRNLRKKINRKPAFELDQLFKSSKRSSLAYETSVRALIRKNPLLTYKDLKLLKVKNVQPIWERFPQRDLHRRKLLLDLSKTLDT
ncbi:MAG: hypothetical protein JWQ35_797 [Bacteriovoracaceae bacterium]|nr:hypothetical protein [Bacteriovoracaceae bacterium]